MKKELTSKQLRWINVDDPEPEELADFVRESNILKTDAEFVAGTNHRPGITVRSDYILILIQVPVFHRKLRLTKGASLFFVIKKGELWTLHYDPIVALEKLRRDFDQSPDALEDALGGGAAHFCLTLTSLLYEGAFRKLERLAKHIDIAEDAIFQGNENKMVEEISLLTRDVMDFRKVVRPQRTLFADAPSHSLVDHEDAVDWLRINGQLNKMWDVLESMFESVRELSGTNFTLLQYKENELLRLLTIYSIVFIPMLILTDPFFNPRAADSTLIDDVVFWVVISVLVLSLVLIFIRVRRKRLI